MDNVCHDLDFAFVYIDDILVATETHRQDLCLLFHCPQECTLVIKVSKFQIGRATIDFLGHCITQAGIMSLPKQ